MESQPPQPPRKRPFRWGSNDPDHRGLSWWGRWVVRRQPRPPGPSAPPPSQKPPAA